jgi:hypothetical protein
MVFPALTGVAGGGAAAGGKGLGSFLGKQLGSKVAQGLGAEVLKSTLLGGQGQAPGVPPPLAQGIGGQPQGGPEQPNVAELLPTGPGAGGMLSPVLAADPMFARGPQGPPGAGPPSTGMLAGPGGTSKAQALLQALLG